MDDLLIRGGLVIDGSGAAGREADVAIGDGRIVAVEPRSARPRAARDRRARSGGGAGVHRHPHALGLHPAAEPAGGIEDPPGCHAGVCVGNCGFSAAPCLPDRAGMLREYLASSGPWLAYRDTTFADYGIARDLGERDPAGGPQHPRLMSLTAGLDNRPLTRASSLPAEALTAGAWGLVRPLHRARHRDAAEIHRPRACSAATGAPLRPTCATRRITSSRRCGRRSRSPRPPASTCRSRSQALRRGQLGRRAGSSRRSRPRAAACDAYP